MQKPSKSADRLVKIIEQFSKLSITVLGDLIADEFIYGEISRVSREAPVLILRHRDDGLVDAEELDAVERELAAFVGADGDVQVVLLLEPLDELDHIRPGLGGGIHERREFLG